MPLPANKVTTPFKTMDIKTALLSSGNRKRKAVSPQMRKSESKCLKLSTENSDHDSDVEILDDACSTKITLQKKELGDCKENKDINATKCDSPVSDLNENQSSEKDELSSNINTVCHNGPKAVISESPKSGTVFNNIPELEKNSKVSCDSNLEDVEGNKDINMTKVTSSLFDSKKSKQIPENDEISSTVSNSSDGAKLIAPKSSKSDTDNDVELMSENMQCSDNSGCEDLNVSVNVSLNTSGLSITGEDENDDKEENVGTKLNSQSGDNSDKKRPANDSKLKTKKKKMTPAEALKKSEERAQKMKERLLKKQELENKKRERMLEKEKKLKEKSMRKEREEFERKERERIKQEKKEQEEKEKQEKLRLKQMLLEQKLEEKKKKEELRLKKEEELKKAEEERTRAKLEKEQKEQREKEKKERAKAAFVKFFVRGEPNTSAPPAQPVEKEGAFLPFQVSDDMTLAPVVPLAAQERFNKKQLDEFLKHQDGKELYLHILKSGSYKDARLRKKNRKLHASEADVIVIDKNSQAEIGLCAKLLQFHENVRPPYWGTWRKKSKIIHARNPFGQEGIFDYEVDSDDEWDEGGPGESLSGTEPEDESEDDYEVDNEFFVPHGYLSDEEEKKDDDEEVNDPEKQKALLKLKLQQFEMERKKKTTELKPIILGCYFVNDPTFQDNGLQVFLQSFAVELLSDNPVPTSLTVKNQVTNNNKTDSPTSSNCISAKKKKVLQLPDEAYPSLIRHIHRSTKNRRNLAEEFQKIWSEQCSKNHQIKGATELPTNTNLESDPTKEVVSDQLNNDVAQISLKQLRQTIKDIASYGKPPDLTFNKYCWWVQDAIREKYGVTDIPIVNQEKNVSKKEPELPSKVNCPSIKVFLSHN